MQVVSWKTPRAGRLRDLESCITQSQILSSMATKSSKQDEAAKLLDDLDNLDINPGASTAASGPPGHAQVSNEGQAADVLAFLDEITLKSSEPTRTTSSHIERPISRAGTPTIRKTTERVKLGGGTPSQPKSVDTGSTTTTPGTAQTEGSGGWGWGKVWTSASAAMKQVQTVVDEQVKHLPTNDAKKWTEGMMEYAKTSQLEQIGNYSLSFCVLWCLIARFRQGLYKGSPVQPYRLAQCCCTANIRARSHPSLAQS